MVKSGLEEELLDTKQNNLATTQPPVSALLISQVVSNLYEANLQLKS